ncbi:hypothetical protein MG296_00750 [Flavobacteriaceae bacterium TK19130]|nr:hypothetical protein [Thermobacterium salinum]
MKEHKVKVRIVPTDISDRELNTRNSFWRFISERIEKENNYPERLEYNFKKNFARELKQSLRNKLQNELREVERNYSVDFRSSFLGEYFYRFNKRSEKNESVYFDDFVNGLAKLQELKNSYIKDNIEYQELLTKNILATQIEFGIGNIRYASLGFDLIVEPFEKAAQIFDNNYELFRIFLDQYIPESFRSSLSIYNDNFPISISIDYPADFRNEFESRNIDNVQMAASNGNRNKMNSKLDKAKWAWTLTNTSLVVPVILALVVLYLTFNKFEIIEKNRQYTFKEINVERDKLLKNYQELINLQKESYQGLIEEIKSDTLK